MKKIMFNDKYGLTQAVLDGRKTQTRRVVMPEFLEGILGKSFSFTEEGKSELLRLSKYKIGEEIAIAQSYRTLANEKGKEGEFLFKKYYPKFGLWSDRPGWNNKMFVEAGLMLHRIKITNIRIERLQDISDEDCVKEGVEQCQTPSCHKNYCTRDCGDCAPSPREAFAYLIDKVSGKGTWDSNPYVFVYEFEQIK